MNLFKSTLLIFSLSLTTFTAVAAPYCDGAWEDHSDKRCRNFRISKMQGDALNATLGEGVATLSRRINEKHITDEDSNYIAFVHASKVCYDTNEAGEYSADLSGSKQCAGIRNSNLSRSLEVYARMERTNVKALSIRAEQNPESLNDLINFLKHQNEDNLDRTNDIWHQVFNEMRKAGIRRKGKAKRL